jgi:hypothetical protein
LARAARLMRAGEATMQRSIYLAKLIGPVLVAAGFGMLINTAVYRSMAEQFLASYALIYLAGVLTLTAGIALVLAHNIWVGDWRIIITIFGWLGVIGGVFRTVWPQEVASIGSSMISHGETFMFAGFAVVVIGGVLSYYGYAEEAARGGGARRSARRRTRRA